MNTRRINPTSPWPWLALAALLLAGCGFQPRGQLARSAAAVGPVMISGLPAHHDFVRALSSELEKAGVAVVKEARDAATAVRIHKQRTERQVMSVDERRKTVEYEIIESVEYSVTRKSSGTTGEKQQLTAQRILFNPGTDLLGRNREETMLRHDMQKELSRRLIQQLSLGSP